MHKNNETHDESINERVVIVRTDTDGNVLKYETIEPKLPKSKKKLRRKRKPSILNMSESGQLIQDNIDYEKIPIVAQSPKYSSDRMSTSRTTLYTRPKSKVKIFTQKVQWNAESKVDSHNENALQRVRRNSEPKIIDDPIYFPVDAKVDSHNEFALKRTRPEDRPKLIPPKKTVWIADAKVDSHNELNVDYQHRTTKQYVHHEKLNWNAANGKIDTNNQEAIERIENAPKTTIYRERIYWISPKQVNTRNPEFIQAKQRNDILREERAKSRAQSFPQEQTSRIDRARIDHFNSEYIEEKERRKYRKLPPIEDQKLEWEKKSRVDQRNDEYIEYSRQTRNIPQIFQQKVDWNQNNTPRVDDHNEEYLDNLRDQRRPRIVNKLPRWHAHSRTDTFNDAYNPRDDYRLKPVIINEKPRWKARPKVNTNLGPKRQHNELTDYGLTT